MTIFVSSVASALHNSKAAKLCQHSKMALRLYFIVIYSIFAAHQNIKLFWRDNGVHSNLGTCFMPVASKSRSDCRWNVTHGVLLMLQFLQNQVIFLMIEHCRRQRCWGHWHHPYFWKLLRPNQSFFEIHYNDRRIPEEYFRKQLQVNQCTFNTLLNALHNTQKYTIVWRHCSRVLPLGLYHLVHGNSYESIGLNFNVGLHTFVHVSLHR